MHPIAWTQKILTYKSWAGEWQKQKDTQHAPSTKTGYDFFYGDLYRNLTQTDKPQRSCWERRRRRGILLVIGFHHVSPDLCLWTPGGASDHINCPSMCSVVCCPVSNIPCCSDSGMLPCQQHSLLFRQWYAALSTTFLVVLTVICFLINIPCCSDSGMLPCQQHSLLF